MTPYTTYPYLLGMLISILKAEQSPGIRRQTVKLLGILGAIDPCEFLGVNLQAIWVCCVFLTFLVVLSCNRQTQPADANRLERCDHGAGKRASRDHGCPFVNEPDLGRVLPHRCHRCPYENPSRSFIEHASHGRDAGHHVHLQDTGSQGCALLATG